MRGGWRRSENSISDSQRSADGGGVREPFAQAVESHGEQGFEDRGQDYEDGEERTLGLCVVAVAGACMGCVLAGYLAVGSAMLLAAAIGMCLGWKARGIA